MEPVIGLDVSKGMSVLQPFMQRNEPLAKAETILHEEQGFRRIREVVTTTTGTHRKGSSCCFRSYRPLSSWACCISHTRRNRTSHCESLAV